MEGETEKRVIHKDDLLGIWADGLVLKTKSLMTFILSGVSQHTLYLTEPMNKHATTFESLNSN